MRQTLAQSMKATKPSPETMRRLQDALTDSLRGNSAMERYLDNFEKLVKIGGTNEGKRRRLLKRIERDAVIVRDMLERLDRVHGFRAKKLRFKKVKTGG